MRISLYKVVLAGLLIPGSTNLLGQDAGDQAVDPKPAQAISQLINEGKLSEAQKALEGAELDARQASQLSRQLLSKFISNGDMNSAYEVAKKDFLANYEDQPLMAMASLSMLSSFASRADKTDDAIGLVDKALNHFAEMDPTAQQILGDSYELSLASTKARLLMMQGNREQAAELNAAYLTKAKQLLENKPDASSAAATVATALMNSAQTAADAESRDKFFAEATDLLKTWLDKDEVDMPIASIYGSVMYGRISSSFRDDPEAAEEMLEQTRSNLEAAAERNPQLKQVAEQYNTMLSRIASSIASAKKLAQLVGSPAPAIDAKYWVNGKDMTVDSLDGKVVLLDFWAVWCGPCIATFPHLREWNEEFGPKGLQVLGITRKYNYTWNEDAKRATRAEEENSDEAEIAMLEKFLAHYELQHPTIITPDESEMQTEYGVSGIPHAVLIDKKGVIRLVKVGSGDANAKAIHDKIVELLAE